jgi:phospholipid-binding lipoprotein MlaA
MNRHRQIATSRRRLGTAWLLATLVLVAGCARAPGVGVAPGGGERLLKTATFSDDSDVDAQDYDPFQPFNERMFWFNHSVLDRWLIKPAATGWSKVAPEAARRGLGRLFDNLEMPRRVINNLFQARPLDAGRELARFAVNTTAGVGGLFDVASAIDLEPRNADAGETLALYGVGAGPYLVLPTFPPLTVRDAIGRGIDGMLDPIGYVLPFFANRAMSIVTAVNERSLNLRLFADVEDSVLDLYTAARNGYLQRRHHVVEEALARRREEWQWAFAPGPTQTAQQPQPPPRTQEAENPA